MEVVWYKMTNRHLTAITRKSLSVPYKLLITKGLIYKDWDILDYGCGKGFDVINLQEKGYNIFGFDPYQLGWRDFPEAPRNRFDIVTCNYVLNVIENPSDRHKVICDCLYHADTVIFAVRADKKAVKDDWIPYKDGHTTTKGMFQKFYTIDDLLDEIHYSLESWINYDTEIILDNSNTKMVLVRRCY